MNLHTIVGTLCGVLFVVDVGWRRAVVSIVLVGGFLTLYFALFSSWVVVAVLLVAAETALRSIRRRRERAAVRPESE
jgi:ABC-type iron transport system FetAB permease component